MDTVETQEVKTPETENKVETKVDTPTTENNGGNGAETKTTEPYKTFTSKNKAEKELLAMLGLKPDEKDKLVKFKEAYDATLSESEKQAKNLENLNEEVKSLKSQITEKDAIISALSKLTGKNSSDVDKYVRMAKGLVDENTSIDQALEQVLDFLKVPESKPIPSGKPLNEPNSTPTVENPFSNGNLTKQGEMIKSDREKAREMYFKAKGVYPSW